MKTKRKALLLTLCAVLLVAASVFGTIAYLTDSEAVTNTFTVGKIFMSLDELDVDDDTIALDNKTYGEGQDATVRDKANEYHLLPGHEYIKDPTIHIEADSEDAWGFVKVENGIADIEAATVADGYTSIADQIKAKGWTELTGVTGVYYMFHAKSNTVTDYVVFEEFKIDGEKVVNVPDGETVHTGKYDLSSYENANITVTGYAVQKDGFATAAEAWNATFGK